jgi:hypothetical protein
MYAVLILVFSINTQYLLRLSGNSKYIVDGVLVTRRHPNIPADGNNNTSKPRDVHTPVKSIIAIECAVYIFVAFDSTAASIHIHAVLLPENKIHT